VPTAGGPVQPKGRKKGRKSAAKRRIIPHPVGFARGLSSVPPRDAMMPYAILWRSNTPPTSGASSNCRPARFDRLIDPRLHGSATRRSPSLSGSQPHLHAPPFPSPNLRTVIRAKPRHRGSLFLQTQLFRSLFVSRPRPRFRVRRHAVRRRILFEYNALNESGNSCISSIIA
jgi:hypothetical protein